MILDTLAAAVNYVFILDTLLAAVNYVAILDTPLAAASELSGCERLSPATGYLGLAFTR